MFQEANKNGPSFTKNLVSFILGLQKTSQKGKTSDRGAKIYSANERNRDVQVQRIFTISKTHVHRNLCSKIIWNLSHITCIELYHKQLDVYRYFNVQEYLSTHYFPATWHFLCKLCFSDPLPHDFFRYTLFSVPLIFWDDLYLSHHEIILWRDPVFQYFGLHAILDSLVLFRYFVLHKFWTILCFSGTLSHPKFLEITLYFNYHTQFFDYILYFS